jgi:TRAP-type C4-dicarboxylate transport system permease small subunit
MIGVRRFAQWGLWFGGALVLLAAVLIGIDVLMRKFLLLSIGGADELAGYALAIGTTWALGAALLDRAHIRIDSLYVLFPQKLRLGLDLTALLLFTGFFVLTLWHGFGVVAQSWTSESRSQSALETPTVIPQLFWIAGLRRRGVDPAGACSAAGRGGRPERDGSDDQHPFGRGGGGGGDPRPQGSAGARGEELTC